MTRAHLSEDQLTRIVDKAILIAVPTTFVALPVIAARQRVEKRREGK